MLTFSRIDLEPSTFCIKDSIRIYDGPFTSSRLIQTICGSNNNTAMEFMSSGNNMYVVFMSDANNVREGFAATYRTGTNTPPPPPTPFPTQFPYPTPFATPTPTQPQIRKGHNIFYYIFVVIFLGTTQPS